MRADAVEREDHTEAATLLRRLGQNTVDKAEKARVALREAELLADGVGDIDTAISRYEIILSDLDATCRPALQAIADLQENRGSLGEAADAILIDMHCEATSEKQAMAHFCDGRVSLVVGTHTHVPTADHQVLVGGTGFISDLGMTGDYDSVIGMTKEEPVNRFLRKVPTSRFEPAAGPATLCGVAVETDDATGLARQIAPVRLGGRLAQAVPPFWD